MEEQEQTQADSGGSFSERVPSRGANFGGGVRTSNQNPMMSIDNERNLKAVVEAYKNALDLSNSPSENMLSFTAKTAD